MNENKKHIKVLISGGGTGGHIFPAIAIANAIKQAQPNAEFLFVGAKGKIEMDKVPQAGYDIIGLTIAGFHRKLNVNNIFRNLLFPFKLIGSLFKAIAIVQKFKPDITIGTGGYASGPTLKAANWLGVKTIIQEQNSYPGITNRLLGAKAEKVCVAYPGMEAFFSKDKLILTGNPVRDTIQNLNVLKAKAAQEFALSSNKPIVFITGGSLGAKAINTAIESNLDKLTEAGVQLLWQCGKLYLEDYKQLNSDTVKVLDFVADMNAAYTCADVIISRAGASTISELAIVGKPAILLPSPNVAEDHQTKNVMALVEKEAAILVHDADANEQLGNVIINVLKNENKQAQLAKNIKAFARPNAARDIAEVVLQTINKNEPRKKQ